MTPHESRMQAVDELMAKRLANRQRDGWRLVGAILAASLLGFVLFGCGSSPVEPAPALNVTGTWSGVITSALGNGSASAKIALTQKGAGITGTWTAGGSTGTLVGTATDQAVTLDLKPSTAGECPYNVTARVERTNEMTGLFSAVQCSGLLSGFVSLVKQ